MGPAELQRYKKLLAEKQQELLFEEPEAESPAPNAGSAEGDLIDIANPDAEGRQERRSS